MNYNVKIDLKKLEKVAVMDIKGKNGQPIKCVVIPVKENNIYVSERDNGGIYLDFKGIEAREMRYGQSHYLKRTVGKEAYSQMTPEERKNMPIVGSLIPYNGNGLEGNQQQTEQPTQQTNNSNYDDALPF